MKSIKKLLGYLGRIKFPERVKKPKIPTIKFPQIKLGMIPMNGIRWKIPDQPLRLSVVVVILLVVFAVSRSILIPVDFGKYGHFRASALDEIVAQEMHYAGHEACYDCHDDVADTKAAGFHVHVSCETCHGALMVHTDDPEAQQPEVPRGRGFCPRCHEYLPSRPTGFPQIVSASHNPMKPCIMCHDPHDPKPPETPKACNACHAEIARTKALSHHVYIECTYCHEGSEEHKSNPRSALPGKPTSRAFCGKCHAKDADSDKGIPRVDMFTHGERYVCWQCHYPHLPEAR